MIKENIYVAVNRNDEIQWVQGSSKKTRYFRTDRYLKRAVEYHNKYHTDDIWEVRKCVILEDESQIDGILFRGNLKEGEYKLIKTTDGWVLANENIVYCGYERSNE